MDFWRIFSFLAYNGKPQKIKIPQKRVKNEFQWKIDPPYQKGHKLRLKTVYLVLTPDPPWGRGGGEKTAKNSIFCDFECILAVFGTLDLKTDFGFEISVKKWSRNDHCHCAAKSWPDFVTQCNLSFHLTFRKIWYFFWKSGGSYFDLGFRRVFG